MEKRENKTTELSRRINGCNNNIGEDYLRESVNWVIETNDPYVLCDFIENVKACHTKEYIKMFEDAIISIGDIVHIYEFMFLLNDLKVKEFDIKRFEEIIRNSGNSKLMLYCLEFVKGIDTESMLQALYRTKNAKYIELLSTSEDYEEIRAAERPEYAEQLRIAKEYNYFPKSLEEFKGETEKEVDIQDLKFQVTNLEGGNQEQKRKKAYLINELANYMEYLMEYHAENYDREVLTKDINSLYETEVEVIDDEPLHAYEFLASVETEDKEAMADKIMKKNHPKFLHYCLEYVPNLSEKTERKLKNTLEKIKHPRYKVSEDKMQGDRA